MRCTLWIAGFVAVAAYWTPVEAEEKFERTYVESTKQVKQSESKVEQTLTIAGMPLETKVTSFQVSNVELGPRDADGNLAVTETVSVLQSNMELPGGITLAFDSGDPDKPAAIEQLNPVLDVFRAVVKNPITTVFDRDNRAKESKIPDGAKAQLSKEYQNALSPERLKRDREQAWLFLPDGEVKPGDAWERMIDSDIGAGQTMNFRMKYTYQGTETKEGKTYHKFGVAHEVVTYALDPNANPMVQVPKSDLKIAKSSGTILYDRETGRIPLRESSVRITGTLTLIVNGQELPGELDLTLSEKTVLQE